MAVAFQHLVDSLQSEICSQLHQTVINILHIVVVVDVEGVLHYNPACVNVVVEEESGDSCLNLTIDDCPVYRCCATILRQQGCMNIECAETRHRPYHLRKHAERHYHLEVGIIGTQGFNKLRVFHPDGLQNRDVLAHRILLYKRRLERVLMTAHGFVGLGHHGNDVIASLHEFAQRTDGKLRSTHEHYT